jgi:hypothetical protein
MAAAGAEEKAAAGSINRAAATASQSVPRMWLTLCEVVMRHRSICRSVPGGSRRAAADESSATSNEQSHGGGFQRAAFADLVGHQARTGIRRAVTARRYCICIPETLITCAHFSMSARRTSQCRPAETSRSRRGSA